jgi:hypothetical protein
MAEALPSGHFIAYLFDPRLHRLADVHPKSAHHAIWIIAGYSVRHDIVRFSVSAKKDLVIACLAVHVLYKLDMRESRVASSRPEQEGQIFLLTVDGERAHRHQASYNA